MLKPQQRRLLRAQLRDTYVLLKQFRLSLLFFIVLITMGTGLFWLFYESPADQSHLTLNQAVFAAFSLIFFQTGNVPYPNLWLVDVLYYLVPLCGLALIGDGLVRFGVQLFNKELRREEWNVSLASTYRNHVIVCGTGRVGYRVIEQLVRFGDEIVAIENDRDRPFIERVRDDLHVALIMADARRPDVLKQARVEQAYAIVPCTNNDLSNLEIALNARELNPKIRVVMRLFEPELAEKVSKGFGLDVAFSTSALAAPGIAAAVRQHDIQQAMYVDDTLVALNPVDVQPRSLWVGRTVGQVEQELDVNLVMLKRKGKIDYRPDHQTVLQAQDHLIIFATMEGIERARKMNKGEQRSVNSER